MRAADVPEHAELARRFFTTVDAAEPKAPRELALAYAEFFWNARDALALPPSDEIYNVCLRTRGGPDPGNVFMDTMHRRAQRAGTTLDQLTKRVHLISDTAVLGDFRSGGLPVTFARDGDKDYTLRCTDAGELGRWLRDCRSLMERGDLFYYPDIIVESWQPNAGPDWDYWMGDIPDRETEEMTKDIFDFIVENGRVADVAATAHPLTSRLVFTVLEAELPFADGTTLGDYCAIATDEAEAYASFRDLLRARFLDLEAAHGSEQFQREIARIGIELRDGVRKVSADLTRVSKRRAVQVAGGAVGTASAVLMAFHSSVLGELLPVLGASGGAWALVDAMADNREARAGVRSSPYYFLWLISRS